MGDYETALRGRAARERCRRPAPAAIRALPPTDRVGQRPHARRHTATARPTTPPRSSARSTRIACSIFPSGFYQVTDTLRLRPDTVLIGLHPSTHPDRPARRQPGLSGRRRAQGADRDAQGRRQHRRRARPVHRRHQPARDGAAVEVGRDVARRRRQDPGRPRHRSCRRHALRSLRRLPRRRSGSAQALGRAVSQHLGDRRRRRHLHQRVEPEHLRAVRLLRLQHDDARPHPAALGRAPRPRRDRPQPGRELGAPRAPDRGGSRREPRRARLEIRNSRNILVANYHGYRVTRTFQPAPMAVRLDNVGRHPLPQRPRERRERSRHLRRQGCATFLRASKFPVRERDRRRDAAAWQVREREFAVLDVPADPAGRARAAAAPGTTVDEARRRLLVDLRRRGRTGRHALLRRPQVPAHPWLERRARASTLERDASARSGQPGGRQVRATCWCCRRSGPKGTVYTFKPGSPETEMTVIAPTPTGARPGVAVAAAGELLEQRRVQGSARSEDLSVHDAGRDVRPRRRHRQGAGIRLTRRQPRPAGLPRVPAGAARSGWRWSNAHADLRVRHRQAGRARLRDQRIGEQDLQRRWSAPAARSPT